MKKDFFKDNNMKEKNKKDNLSQFDLDIYACTVYGTSLPGKDKTKQEILHKKSVGGHRKKDAPSGDAYLYDEVKFIVFTLVNRHIDITTPYEEWINLGFALSDGLGEDGRGFFHQLSSMNAEYNYEECDKKYTSCMKGNGKGITIQTFFKMAKDVGVDLKTIAREGTVRATCANVPNAKYIENIEKYKNSGILDKEMAHGTMAPVAQTITTGYTFSDKVNEKDLPFCLRNVYKIHASLCSSPAPLARFLVFSHRLRMAWAVDSSSTTCLTTRWSFTMYSPVATPLWKTPISRWARTYCLSITLCWRERAILSSLS